MIRWVEPLSLIFVAFLVFANTLPNPFVHDEIVFILQNPNIGHFNDILNVFTGTLSTPSTPGVNAYYRPLLELVYRLEYFFFGFNPWGWHLVNIILHGLNGILLWRLLGLLGVGGVVSWATALLFIIHPVQTEAVACIAGISNLLMAFFVLIALLMYVKGRWLLSMLFFLMGLLAKEQSIIVLPLIGLIDWYRKEKHPRRWFLFGLMTISFLVLRQVLTGAHTMADIFVSMGELKLRLLSIAHALVVYLKILVWPNDLHYYRLTDFLKTSPWWWLLIILVGMLAVRANRLTRFCVLWFIISILPVIGIIPLVNEYSFLLSAEHFLYLPMIGFMLFLVFWGEQIIKRRFILVLAIVVAVLASLTFLQNRYWSSERVLFERMIQFEPNFGRGHLLLAKAYYFEHNYMAANEHFEKSYKIMMDYKEKAYGEGPKQFYEGFIKEILHDWSYSREKR